jgi:hypothetical protein
MTRAIFSEQGVRATYQFLAHAGRGVTELRVIAPGSGVVGIGYFDSEDAFVNACASTNGAGNVYVGIQPRPPALFERAPNHLARLRTGARDDDVGWVSSIIIDIDPVRPKNTAATSEELKRSVVCGDRISDWCTERGFQRPVRNISGNGCQLWFAIPPIELCPQSRIAIRDRLKAFEAELRDRFAGDGVAIDSIYNFSRIIKVIGTLSVKGDDTPERPHRLSCSIDPFERREDAALLEALFTQELPDQRPAEEAAVIDAAETRPPQIAETPDPWLRAFLYSDTSIGRLFQGQGKSPVGQDGVPVDTSSSGYDYSLALELAILGFNPDDLATALWHRPDGRAREKGLGYIQRTVTRALDKATQVEERMAAETRRGACNDNLPMIVVNGRQLIDIIEEAWAAIRQANDPPCFFLRAGELVRLREKDGVPKIEDVTKPIAYGHLCRVARWVHAESGDKPPTNAAPRMDVAADLIVNPEPTLPKLDAVVLAPVFDQDAALISRGGYHARARLWYHKTPNTEIPPVPKVPGAAEVARARSLLLDDLLVDFPFVSEADLAHAVAALLLPFLRRMIDGCTPLHLVQAPSQGTGKGLLADILTRFATLGKDPSVMPIPKAGEEIRKSVTAVLKDAPTVILLDNVEDLTSNFLAMALTTKFWKDRILGETRVLELPNQALWIATGNNPALSQDMSRRIALIELQSQHERPWLRSPELFKHHPLLDWVEKNRAELVWSCLVLIQSWIAAGRPETNHNLGSFDRWAKMMGGLLTHIDLPGFLGNLPRLYQDTDDEGQEWRSFVAAWWQQYQHNWIEVGRLLKLANSQTLLSHVLFETRSAHAQKITLGRALGRARNRNIDGRLIKTRFDNHRKCRVYALQPVGT